ncbi:hypothetical protein [Delftia acidovorans]|uniref:hypothetical protein n=1 Tax=Delftia acidovorans TaxID=80866 RepID=UPI00192C7CC7|nr:hypothetical protein [Delftia acidovorans]
MGRFVRQDPIGLFGGVNNYQYAPNPVGWVGAMTMSGRVTLLERGIHRTGAELP